jgi:hypothetical protein
MDIECPLKTHVLDSSFPRLMMFGDGPFQGFSDDHRHVPERIVGCQLLPLYYLHCGCDQSGFLLQPDLAMICCLNTVLYL